MGIGGFDYLDDVSKKTPINKGRQNNLQVEQEGYPSSPAEGSGGFVGGNSNAGSVGFDYVTGKSGSVTNKPLWSTQSSIMGINDNAGSGDADEKGIQGMQDSTDQYAPYKRVQMDEGLPQTFRKSTGAGDASPAGADEPDQGNGAFGRLASKSGNYKTDLNLQGVPSSDAGDHELSDMPQTEYTQKYGGGAPLFKHQG